MSMDQRQWGEAEQVLRDLIEENGIHWVEPVNRLATLLYMQGRLEESKHLCEVVLRCGFARKALARWCEQWVRHGLCRIE